MDKSSKTSREPAEAAAEAEAAAAKANLVQKQTKVHTLKDQIAKVLANIKIHEGKKTENTKILEKKKTQKMHAIIKKNTAAKNNKKAQLRIHQDEQQQQNIIQEELNVDIKIKEINTRLLQIQEQEKEIEQKMHALKEYIIELDELKKKAQMQQKQSDNGEEQKTIGTQIKIQQQNENLLNADTDIKDVEKAKLAVQSIEQKTKLVVQSIEQEAKLAQQEKNAIILKKNTILQQRQAIEEATQKEQEAITEIEDVTREEETAIKEIEDATLAIKTANEKHTQLKIELQEAIKEVEKTEIPQKNSILKSNKNLSRNIKIAATGGILASFVTAMAYKNKKKIKKMFHLYKYLKYKIKYINLKNNLINNY